MVHLHEKVRDYEVKIAAVERKVGQLTMELDALKKTLAHQATKPVAPLSIISGPGVCPPGEDVAS